MILALDWGLKKIGLAIASEEVKIASPFRILAVNNFQKTLQEIKQIIEEENITQLVLGKPKNLNGSDKEIVAYDKFVGQMQQFNLPIFFIDERMSTKLAKRWQRDLGEVNGQDDALAACAILQNFLQQNYE